MNKTVYTILILLLPFINYSQGETNNWLLGGGDILINFNSGSPQSVVPNVYSGFPSGGFTPIPWHYYFYTFGGSASISDKDGNLQLYSNGYIVYTKNFDTLFLVDVTPDLMAWKSWSTQCLFIPKPGNPDRYYFFSTPYLFSNQGVKYFEIDMSLNNGNGGLVSSNNLVLQSPSCQKVTAVYHANGKDIWVLTHEWDNNAFHAFLVTKNGINLTSVISNTGIIHKDPFPLLNQHDSGSAGQMKFSCNGRKLAVAGVGLDTLQVFDFNNVTGVVSNPITFPMECPENVEFSNDGTVLYVANKAYQTDLSADSARISQIDLLAGNAGQVQSSIVHLTDNSTYYKCRNYLQLGYDGRIYFTHSGCGMWLPSPPPRVICCINQPNTPGVNCEVDTAFFNIPGNGVLDHDPRHLPNFFCSYLDRNILFANQCFGDTTLICTQTNTDFDSIQWEFTDPILGAYSMPNQDTIYHQFSAPGEYDIVLKRYRNNQLDECKKRLYINPNLNINLGNDTIICEGTVLNLALNEPGSQFAWVNDFSNDTVNSNNIAISQAGQWWPILTNFEDYCGYIDTIQVDLYLDSLNLGVDTSGLCSTTPVTLDAALSGNTSYMWSTGDTSSTLSVDESGFYWVEANEGYCTFQDTIHLLFDDLLFVDLQDTILICTGSGLWLSAGDFPADFLWSPNGETVAEIFIDSAGVYSVTASNGCGDVSDSTVVIVLDVPNINLGNDTMLCYPDTVYLNAWSPFSDYEWSTGDSSAVLLVDTMDTYAVTVTNQCGSGMDEIVVSFHYPFTVNLGNDTIICLGDILELDAIPIGTPPGNEQYIWSTGGMAQTEIISQAGTYYVTVINYCFSASDTINVEVHENDFAFLMDSVFLPDGQTATLDAGSGYINYLWSTFETSSSIEVTDYGMYWVEVTDSIGCLGMDSIKVVWPANINEGIFNDISIYPNPTENDLIVDGLLGHETLTLFDSQGRLVQRKKSNSQSILFNLEHQPNGVYWIQVELNERAKVFKVVKR